MITKIKKEVPNYHLQRYLVDKKKNKLGIHDVCRCTYNAYPHEHYTNIWATLKGPFRKYDAQRYIVVYSIPEDVSRHDSDRMCISSDTLRGLLKSKKGGLHDFQN